MKKTDAQLQTDVISELTWDVRVEATAIGVEVEAGVVTLSGAVPSWAMKLAAADAAHRVAGVLDVANDLIVKVPGARHGDADIAAAVRHALCWDVYVPDELIQSTVSNGLVTLTGHVDTASQRDDAARAVGNLAGVCGVDNRILVKRLPVAADEIRLAIARALDRRAEREAEKIQIDVDGSAVTLHGPVESWAERNAVVAAARATRGVNEVFDHLRIA